MAAHVLSGTELTVPKLRSIRCAGSFGRAEASSTLVAEKLDVHMNFFFGCFNKGNKGIHALSKYRRRACGYSPKFRNQDRKLQAIKCRITVRINEAQAATVAGIPTANNSFNAAGQTGRFVNEFDAPGSPRYDSSTMARYIARTCPKCRNDFWVTISHPMPESRELPIIAWCPACGYRLSGWRLFIHRQPPPEIRYGRMRKVFK